MTITNEYTVTKGLEITIPPTIAFSNKTVGSATKAIILTPGSDIGRTQYMGFMPSYKQNIIFICQFNYPDDKTDGFLCQYEWRSLGFDSSEKHTEIIFLDRQNTIKLLEAAEKDIEKQKRNKQIEERVKHILGPYNNNELPTWSCKIIHTKVI